MAQEFKGTYVEISKKYYKNLKQNNVISFLDGRKRNVNAIVLSKGSSPITPFDELEFFHVGEVNLEGIEKYNFNLVSSKSLIYEVWDTVEDFREAIKSRKDS